MPREIFGEVSNPSVKLGSQAWYTVPLSILVHAVLLAVIVVVPLVATDVLPSPPTMYDIFIAPPDLPKAPPPPAAASVPPKAPRTASSPDAAPINAPDRIAPEIERPPLSSVGVPGGDPGVPSGVLPSVLVDVPSPPAPPPLPQRPAFVRPGGDIKTPTKIHHVAPVYPTIAQQARVEGTVIIEATIGTDGRVKDARVLQSEPLLEQAAIEAVRQWRFTPTLLNGVPVPVKMTVTVSFKLH